MRTRNKMRKIQQSWRKYLLHWCMTHLVTWEKTKKEQQLITKGTISWECYCIHVKYAQQERRIRKNITKENEDVTYTKRNKHVFLDILTINKPNIVNNSILTKKNWSIIGDEFIVMKISDFYDTKNVIIEPTCERFEKCKQKIPPGKFC